MDRQNAKKSAKTLLALLLVMFLVLVVLISMTACSIFTDAVKSVFGGENAASSGGKDGDSTASSDLVVDSPSDDGAEDPGIITSDPAVDVGESEVVTIAAESLVYDKASATDMQISATHEGKDYYGVIGMGLISDGINKRIAVAARTRGSSTVVIDGEYLCTFPADNYYIDYCVSDPSGRIYYEPFRLEVVNSAAVPTDVKISYDIDCPNTYVCFRCDCGGAHRVTFDGVYFDAIKGATRTRINTAVDKAISHTAVVTCVSTSRASAPVTKAAPTVEAIEGKYLLEEKSYSYKGHKADAYIEDDAEAADLLEYLAYQGAVTSMKTYVSEAIHAAINANASAYLSSIQSAITVPWSLQFGCSYSNVSRVVTFKIEGTNAGAPISSGYSDPRPYEKISVASHYTPAEEPDTSRELAINGKTGVGVRNVKELLAVVEAGYRPIAEDETLALYNKAKNFCYTYLNDEMSDVEKLHVIYDYLAGEIDYDYAALNLYNLIATISQRDLVGDEYVMMSLDEAKGVIDDTLAAAELETDPSKKFSSAMIAAINAAKDSVLAPQTTADLVAALKVDYLQRLSAFSVEGVFDDGAAVCEGISYAFMLLARIEGIECYQITGVASQGNSQVAHAWNKVHLDGKWYCIDATWGNIHLNDSKYVTHRYFMVDDGVFSVDHIETLSDTDAAVANLAIGNVEYYKSVETSTGRTLYVRNNADVEAAVAYFYAAGSHYIEVMVDPTYKPTSGTFGNAYMKAAGTTHYSITSSTTGNVFIAYIE